MTGRRIVTVSLVLLASVLQSGCVHKYNVPPPEKSDTAVRSQGKVYVAMPSPGRDEGGREYEDSGRWTSNALADALREHGVEATQGREAGSLEQARSEATAAGCQLVVYPEIAHWSDRATEWSGIPDRITLNVEVVEAASGAVLDDRQVQASSRWATFGGDHPQDLLPELSRQWALSLAPRD